jgi:GDP-mannose 6-dehydrogenase
MFGSGRSPIVEPRMGELVAEGFTSGRLQATNDSAAAVRESQISFVCVGTPGSRNGRLELAQVENVAREIGTGLREKETNHIVALRSTVLPGTTESVFIPALEAASGRVAGRDFIVCYNPEFMREASAVGDFFQPPCTIFGRRDGDNIAPMNELFGRLDSKILETSFGVAEMAKYASNAFHALKISFSNEIGTLCKVLDVDAAEMTRIFLSDTKLNASSAYLQPGFAFGGSCLPKDLRALNYRAKERDLHLPLLQSILASNTEHLSRAVAAVLQSGKRHVSVLGLSFKAGTDDLRESPQVELIKRLLGEGCQVRIWDKDVSLGRLAGANRQYIEEVIPHIGSLLSTDLQAVVRLSEVLVVATTAVDKQELSRYILPHHIVFDLVHLDRAQRVNGGASTDGICW